MPDCLHYLEKLVSFNTVSDVTPENDMPNRPLIDWAEETFRGFGFETRVIEVAPGKADLLAWKGPLLGHSPEDPPSGLLLSGHSDTVGCDPERWQSDPWTLTIRDGKAYGLGSCDMKGFIACAMALSEKLPKEPTKGFGVLITCDEETSMQGARKASEELARLGVKPELCIIGEPTELTPIFGHKGYMARKVDITGRACHSSNPDLGVNAAKIAADVIRELSALEARMKENPDPDFSSPGTPGVPWPTLNIGSIRGGDSVNRVCASVRLEFDARPTPTYSADQIREDLAALEAKLSERYPRAIHFEELYPDLDPFSNPNPEVRRQVEDIAGKKGQFVSYATEASFLQKLGPTVVFGPGSIDQAHGIDEFTILLVFSDYLNILKLISYAII